MYHFSRLQISLFKREKKRPTNKFLHLHLLLLQTAGGDFVKKSKIYSIL